jgi:hypothetical protein
MNTPPETFPPEPDDEARFVAFLRESANATDSPPEQQVAEWKSEILAAALESQSIDSGKRTDRPSPLRLVPFPLRVAWAALWITAAGFHFITPEPLMSTPPVRRPTAATFQQLNRSGQSLRTITPLVRFHTLKRELQLR